MVLLNGTPEKDIIHGWVCGRVTRPPISFGYYYRPYAPARGAFYQIILCMMLSLVKHGSPMSIRFPSLLTPSRIRSRTLEKADFKVSNPLEAPGHGRSILSPCMDTISWTLSTHGAYLVLSADHSQFIASVRLVPSCKMPGEHRALISMVSSPR
jgi:hypothetical protein